MSTPRRGLGRGLDSLIPVPGAGPAATPEMIDVDLVRPGAGQVRRSFDQAQLEELAGSIRQHGLLQPVVVSRSTDGYDLIAGERRWRAARLAGLRKIPAVIRDIVEGPERLVLGLIENLQRNDLNPIEEAAGYQRLSREFGLTHEQIAAEVGKHRVAVSQALRLLQAAPAVQAATASEAISAGHARALAGLPDFAAQEQGLKVVIARRLSVRQTEQWVKDYRASGPPRRHRTQPGLADVAGQVSARLGVPVRIRGTAQRGSMTIRFNSASEFERLVSLLSGDT